jgi:hypothetical protein
VVALGAGQVLDRVFRSRAESASLPDCPGPSAKTDVRVKPIAGFVLLGATVLIVALFGGEKER